MHINPTRKFGHWIDSKFNEGKMSEMDFAMY